MQTEQKRSPHSADSTFATTLPRDMRRNVTVQRRRSLGVPALEHVGPGGKRPLPRSGFEVKQGRTTRLLEVKKRNLSTSAL